MQESGQKTIAKRLGATARPMADGLIAAPLEADRAPPTPMGFLAEFHAFSSVVRHLFADGLQDGIEKCWQALPILWNLREHRKYARVLRQPHVQPLKTAYPRLAYKYLGHSLSMRFTTRKRLKILREHYEYLAPRVRPDFLKNLFDSRPTVWQEEREGHRFDIKLSFPHPDDQEGDFALSFERDDVALYQTSFVICSGDSIGAHAPSVIFIARMQGGGERYGLIRAATHACVDVSPADMLMSALEGLSTALGIRMLVGVDAKSQVSKSAVDKPRGFFDYDGFWRAYGGDRTPTGVYAIRLPFPEKPIELVKAKHRGRTARKRVFKNEIAECVRQHCAQNFLKTSGCR